MADVKIGIAIDAGESKAGAREVKQSLSEVGEAAHKAKEKVHELKETLEKGLAFIGIAFGLHEILEATIEAEQSLAKLRSSVQATGGAAGRSVDQLEELANALQKTTTFSDDAVMSAESMMLTFDKVRGPNFDRAIKDATDLATKMGGDLPGAAFALGKALQSPSEALSMLIRQIGHGDAAQEAYIKRLDETGHKEEAQAALLAMVEGRVKGAAAAMRNTLGGALQGLKNDFDNLMEGTGSGPKELTAQINTLSETLADPAIRDAIQSFVGMFFGAFDWIIKAANVWGAWYAGIIFRVVNNVSGFFRLIPPVFDEVTEGLKSVSHEMLAAVLTAVAGAINSLGDLLSHIPEIGPAMAAALHEAAAGALGMADAQMKAADANKQAAAAAVKAQDEIKQAMASANQVAKDGLADALALYSAHKAVAEVKPPEGEGGKHKGGNGPSQAELDAAAAALKSAQATLQSMREQVATGDALTEVDKIRAQIEGGFLKGVTDVNSALGKQFLEVAGLIDAQKILNDTRAAGIAQMEKDDAITEQNAKLDQQLHDQPLNDARSRHGLATIDENGVPQQINQFDQLGQSVESITSLMTQMGTESGKAFALMGQGLKGLVDQAQSLADAKVLGDKGDIEGMKKALKDASSQGVKAYASLAAGAQGFFKQGSDGYKVMGGASKAFYAADLAMQVESTAEKLGLIATIDAATLAGYAKTMIIALESAAVQIASWFGIGTAAATAGIAAQAAAPPPASFGYMSAMAAIMAGLGFAVGGMGGGSSKSPVAAQRSGANAGQGGVLGDSKAASESIQNSIDQLGDYAASGLEYSQAMLQQLKDINQGINGVGRLLYQSNAASGGATPFANYKGHTSQVLGGITDLLSSPGALGQLGLSKLPVVGSIVGAVGDLIGGLIGSFLGHTKKTLVDSGLKFDPTQTVGDAMGGDLQAQYYATIKKKKSSAFGISHHTSYSEKTAALEDATVTQFEKVIGGLSDTVITAVGALGGNVEQAQQILASMALGFDHISLDKLSGDEVQKKIAEVFSALGDRMASSAAAVFTNIDLTGFQQVGEGMLQTLVRVASGFEYAQTVTERMGIAMVPLTNAFADATDIALELVRASVMQNETQDGVLSGVGEMVDLFSGTADDLVTFVGKLNDLRTALTEVGASGASLSSAMVNAAGGVDALQSALGTYQDDYFSDAEKAAAKTNTLRKEFARLGREMPTSRAGFRELIEGIDTSTDAGQKLFGQVISLAGGFNDLQEMLTQANEAQLAMQDTLRQTIEDARGVGKLPEQTLNDMLGKFNNAFALALSSSGSELVKQSQSMNDLIGPLVDQIRLVYASGAQGQELIDYILSAGDSIVNKLGGTAALPGVAADATIPADQLAAANATGVPSATPTEAATISALQEQNEHLTALVSLQQAANEQLIAKLSALQATVDEINSTVRLEASA